MKKLLIFSTIAAFALTGCQIDEPEITDVQEQKAVFTATIDDGFDNDATRTSLDSNGNVLWKAGDQVSIFYKSTINEQYQVTDASDGKTTAGLSPVSSTSGSSESSPSFVAGGEITNNVAFYPYASGTELSKTGSAYTLSKVQLPTTQVYAEGSFGNGAFPMAAVTSSTTDMNLKFKNVLGGLKLQLKGSAKIASITVIGNADEILCGSANVTVSSTAVPKISLTDTDADAKTVTLNCGTAGVQLNSETATTFIIALPPVTMAKGFTVTVTDTYGRNMKIETTKSQTITRSNLLAMPEVDYVGTVEDYNSEPFTITSVGNTTVALVKEGSPADITLEYRTGGSDWEEYTIGTEISLTDGAILQFRAGEGGNATFSKYSDLDVESLTTTDRNYKIEVVGSGAINVSGNIMSLLDRTLSIDTLPENAFCYLFQGCTNLKDLKFRK